ncbi:Detected protein of unknown function [Hibiscus syriacus]|uniref:Uncharacterized protein n=1 Tax=Hibiscus syriacus TaxID=106335 RepID=A0A6A2WPD1_HIBSY|nr:Detected protein of unknown function [Hibiscus syriacus]
MLKPDSGPTRMMVMKPEKHCLGAVYLCGSISDIISEAKLLFNLAFPVALTGLILYSCFIIFMLFLDYLDDMELVAGSLAIAFAKIISYSVLSSLALGMEPLCSQAFGAQRHKLLSLTLHRYIVFLLFTSVLISFFGTCFSPSSIYSPTLSFTRSAFTFALKASPAPTLSHFNFDIAGIAASASISNFFVLISLVAYIWVSGIHKPRWEN